ncbi:hypothetical protein BGX38DRAFT_1272004 [Terfezia claveryi]|nr:hypothetical protein BGX38DRAFT_1272004 [Terfezia claveryi]
MPILNRRVPKSPRHLALRHAKKRFGTPDEHAHVFGGIVGKPEALAPGEERLYSYYKPSLVAGTYDVTTEQYISNGTHKALKLTAVQSFTVVTPQFALPAGAIHSQYPPEGHADVVETLPHVVLTDPHLPWERIATDKKQPDEGFNTIPWLALMVFTPEELQLPEDHPLLRNQTETKTVTLSLARLLEQSVSRVIPSSFLESNPDTEADFIFIEPGMFNELTTEYDPEILKEGPKINAAGEFEDEEGVFGVVVAHRAGPMDNEVAKPLIAHLVSIEYVAGTPWPLALDKRVALTSLYSWTYMSLPADSFSVGQAMVHLGDTMAMLRPPQPTIDRLLADNKTKWIGQRLNDGYTLAKYRTSTGEISAALFRGPFAPTTIEHKLKTMSFFGTELQVMDKQTGLMDLTYCIAWHVGRTQALGDQAFTAALGRLRTAIHREGLKLAQKEALKAENHPVVDLKDALGSLSRGIRTLNEISSGTSTRNVPGHAVRWVRDAAEPLDISFASPAVSTRFKAAANTVMAELSSSKDGNVYNEINAHNFPDWPIVMSWVLDRMYLGNLPSQYIVPDPTHLPRESLRFFHIDPNWVEALIDGGLAVANQVEKDDDKIRVCIKNAITKYLQTPMGKGSGAYLPQVPTHGFLMRSELVTKYPDLILEAPFTDTSEEEMELKPASILRQENLDSTVLLALFDRVPGSPDFKTLIFRQPPHQQSFAAAATSDPPDEKKLNINSDPYPMNNPLCKSHIQHARDKVQEGLRQGGAAKADLGAHGIQLNNPMLYLEIRDKKRPPLETSSMRSLLMLDPATTPVDTATTAPRILHAGKMFDLTSSLPSLSLPVPPANPRPPPLRGSWGHHRGGIQPHHQALSRPPPLRRRRRRASILHPRRLPQDQLLMLRLRHDLIFSIQIDPDSIYDFNLYELQIEIRLGPMGGQRKTLARNYDGPGARMLSNLRFNVIPVTSEDGNLLIRLLPRSTREAGVPLTMVKELSFVLNGVVVNRYRDEDLDKGCYKVYTVVTEKYGSRGDQVISDKTSDHPTGY